MQLARPCSHLAYTPRRDSQGTQLQAVQGLGNDILQLTAALSQALTSSCGGCRMGTGAGRACQLCPLPPCGVTGAVCARHRSAGASGAVGCCSGHDLHGTSCVC